MTALPLSTDTIYNNFESDATRPEWARRCFLSSSSDNTVTEDVEWETETTESVVPQISLPEWAEIVDEEVNEFLRSYHLENDLDTCLKIISAIFKSKQKANIRLVEDRDCDREYISISLTPSKSQEDSMADYLYNCNNTIAHSLPRNLRFFVLSME